MKELILYAINNPETILFAIMGQCIALIFTLIPWFGSPWDHRL